MTCPIQLQWENQLKNGINDLKNNYKITIMK